MASRSLSVPLTKVERIELKQKLIRLIRLVSYREGDFKLVSGKKSNFYIDLKPTILHPEGAKWVGRLAFDEIYRQGIVVEGVGGLTLGADPIATALSLTAWSQGVYWPAYIVRKEPKMYGTSRYIEGVENLHAGIHLLVLEDVVTTGGSSLKAVEHLKNAGYQPTAVLACVDREEGGASVIHEKGLAFIALLTLQDIQSFV